jgi:hypothetical protein
MEFIEGDYLSDTWDQYDAQQKDCIFQQLHDMFARLRSIRGTLIGFFHESACGDPLFEGEMGKYEPYKCEASFNQSAIATLKNTLWDCIGLNIRLRKV